MRCPVLTYPDLPARVTAAPPIHPSVQEYAPAPASAPAAFTDCDTAPVQPPPAPAGRRSLTLVHSLHSQL